jgi:hypothetical protein
MNKCFFLNVYKDEKLAIRLLKQLNTFYPNATVLVICDGDSTLESFGDVKVFKGERLKKQGFLNKFIIRNFSICLEHSFDTYISLDPDTYIWKPFTKIPEEDWFGQVNKSNLKPFNNNKLIVGACAGYSFKALNSLIGSKLLESPIVDLAPLYKTALTGETVPAEDYVIGWALETLGFVPYQWEDNDIQQGITNKQTTPYKYSATHPVKAAIDYSKLK